MRLRTRFFNESYLEPHNLDDLTRSLGFCPMHAARLARSPGGRSQLAAVHAVVARRIRAQLSAALTRHGRDRGPAVPLIGRTPCPPCRSREETGARELFWLADVLEDPRDADRYARPGLLCVPHLRAFVSRV